MDPIDILSIAVIAIVCGSMGQLTSGHSRGGWFVNLPFAAFGAFVGMYLARYFNAPKVFDVQIGKSDFPALYALAGSALAVGFISFLVRPSNR